MKYFFIVVIGATAGAGLSTGPFDPTMWQFWAFITATALALAGFEMTK